MIFEEVLKTLSFVFAVIGIIIIFIISGISDNSQSVSFFNGSIRSLHCTKDYCTFETFQTLKFKVFVKSDLVEKSVVNTSHNKDIYFMCRGNSYLKSIYCEDFSLFNDTQLLSR